MCDGGQQGLLSTRRVWDCVYTVRWSRLKGGSPIRRQLQWAPARHASDRPFAGSCWCQSIPKRGYPSHTSPRARPIDNPSSRELSSQARCQPSRPRRRGSNK